MHEYCYVIHSWFHAAINVPNERLYIQVRREVSSLLLILVVLLLLIPKEFISECTSPLYTIDYYLNSI